MQEIGKQSYKRHLREEKFANLGSRKDIKKVEMKSSSGNISKIGK